MLDQSLMQVLQMAAQIRNNPNPEQMFMRMFGNNPEVQGIMNQYKGMNEQQLQGKDTSSLCKALKTNKPYHNHIVEYANQQPS